MAGRQDCVKPERGPIAKLEMRDPGGLDDSNMSTCIQGVAVLAREGCRASVEEQVVGQTLVAVGHRSADRLRGKHRPEALARMFVPRVQRLPTKGPPIERQPVARLEIDRSQGCIPGPVMVAERQLGLPELCCASD